MPVRGSHVLSALCIQLAELGVAAVRGEVGDEVSIAPPSQLGNAGAAVGGVTEQLRSKEHALDLHPAVLQPLGRFHGKRGSGGVAPEQDLLQTTSDDLCDNLLHNALHRRE